MKKRRDEELDRVLKFDVIGPFGSSERGPSFCVDEVYSRLREEKSELRELWTRRSMSAFKLSLEKEEEQYTPSVELFDNVKSTLIEGDKCKRCKVHRAGVMRRYENLREVLRDRSLTLSGRKHGIVVGIPVADGF